jgi:hypothetical protein
VRFQCPNCPDGEIGLRGSVCPKCGYTLTVGNLFALGWQQLRGFFGEEAVLRCPKCDRPMPLNATKCPNPACGLAITVEMVTAGSKSWWREFVRSAAPILGPLLQWGFLLLSVVGLIFMLSYAERQETERWPKLVGLSMIYLGVLTLVAKLVMPVRVIEAVVHQATGPVKLALICNYFSVLLLLLIALNTWWSRSLILAVLFGVSLMGLWIFQIVLAPSFLRRVLPGRSDRYNTTAPQGRRGRHD